MMRYSDKGVVLQMQDYSIHDGAGVRTTVFLAGCPLRCKWCANPESWTIDRKLVFYKHKCVNCKRCSAVCPNGLSPVTMGKDKEKCKACGECVKVCTSNALEIACTEKDANEVIDNIKRDSLFFRFTGGGVTFSGGEPFLQQDFLRTLAKEFSKMGIDMWVETCGQFEFDQVYDILEKISHVFLDLKHMDSDIHKTYTGVGNEKILENAKKISEMGIPVTVRIPSILEVNLTEENIRNTAKFMKENMKDATIELLPYHSLGKAKYIALGIEDKFTTFTTPTKQQIEKAYSIFEEYGIIGVEFR